MSAAIRKVTVDGGDVEYDSDMKMGALKGLLSSASGGDLEGLVESLASFVVSWPYGGEPMKPSDWDELTRTEFNECVSAIVEDLGTLGEA